MAISAAPVASAEWFRFAAAAATLPGLSVPAGDDRLLIVTVHIFQNSAMPTVSGITHGGVAMSKTDGAAANMTTENVDDTRRCRVEIWKLVAPATGTNDIVITLSGSFLRLYATASIWTGVHQTTPLRTYLGTQSDSTGTTVTPTETLTTGAQGVAAGDVVVDAMAAYNDTQNHSVEPAAGAGQTAIQTHGTANNVGSGSSYEAGAASVTMSWTITPAASDTVNWAIGAVPLVPSTTTSPVASGSTASEMRLNPLRVAPRGLDYSNIDSLTSAFHQGAALGLSGMYPLIFRARFEELDNGEQMILDSVYALPSVAKGGAMAVTQLPTPNSPNGSLVVTTMDTVLQYPLPYSGDPALTDTPNTARSGVDADIVPLTKFSDYADGQARTLDGIRVRLEHVSKGVDFCGVAFAWDDGNDWSRVIWQSGSNLWFSWGDTDPDRPKNGGYRFRLIIALYDGAVTDRNCPRIAEVTPYFVDIADELVSQMPDARDLEGS